ncbi:Ankyrin_repeat protein 1 [Hexamita inflata]|uniref:Ankyrin repeat protein 1 n=1 Tax=Hexamita inflata TaxID=28002 RepID=A0AA86NYU4_9EUKA|nr:Ankyrin repeat protein 1 [Hexamita inflata]
MGSCVSNGENWFTACKYNDCDYIKNFNFAHSELYDKRELDQAQYIFTGFAGVHYASYFGHLNAVQLLKSYEPTLVTQSDTILTLDTCQGIVEGIKICPGLSGLQLSILSNACQVSNMFFEGFFLGKNQQIMFMSQNAMFTVFSCQILNGSFQALEQLEKYHRIYLQKDARTLFQQNINPLMLAVYMGRKSFVSLILQLSESALYSEYFEVFVINQDYKQWKEQAYKIIPLQLLAKQKDIDCCFAMVKTHLDGKHEPVQDWMGGVGYEGSLQIQDYINHTDMQRQRKQLNKRTSMNVRPRISMSTINNSFGSFSESIQSPRKSLDLQIQNMIENCDEYI